MFSFKKPENRLSKKVIKLWLVSNLLTYTSLISLVIILIIISKLQSWTGWFFSILPFIVIVLIILSIIEFVFIIKFKYYLFSFELGDDFIRIEKGGWLFKKFIIVPIRDIYFIDIYQGPLLKKFDLCALNLNTIAHKHEIVGIDSNYAKFLKDQMEINDKFKNKEKFTNEETT
ncbi:PH domain-containing protein [Staphylococcus hominis]|uniref:PH domain-containing protein n=1 Tax=Staphylococcus hominis TaxID=1290 RepID=UPI0016437414|nr:PH domain-containing protein [Staphylococcus hominis]